MIFWDWSIGLAIGTAVCLYLRGWWLQSSADAHNTRPRARLIATFLAATLLLVGALYSPLHHLATRYFFIHALQRLLLVAAIPCLFFNGNPLPIMLAGLPTRLRTALVQLPQTAPRFYTLLIRAIGPVPVWFLFVATYWLWHDVQIDRLVLQIEWLHRLENVMLLGTAVLYWWHILAAPPRLHPPMAPLWRVAYAASGAAPVKLVGLILMFQAGSVYQYPADISIYNLDITDQSLGAGIVWVAGGIVFTWTAVILMRDWLKDEDNKPGLPESLWSSDETMLAPGFGRSKTYRRPSK